MKNRLKALKDDPDSEEEEAALNRCLELMDTEADAKKAVKEAQDKLDAAVLKKYDALSKDEIKLLTVKDKWFASIQMAIDGEVNCITQRLAERVKELDERYSDTMPALDDLIEQLGAKVDSHLKQMGLVWA